ncbi:MAG: NAD(P)-dependent oxidoreductase [Proteobacteria bacterium]|nr:NAD(P)-dependent oxidoreductase [Pseudomonadota bacterium]
MTDGSRAIVLGGTGFLGRTFASVAVRRGWRVQTLGSRTLDLGRPESVRALAARFGPETWVFACAARTLDGAADSTELFDANTALDGHLAEALTACPVAGCVYLSSASVYGDAASQLDIDEATPLRPTTHYGGAKVVAERRLREAAQAGGFPLIVLRPCRIYGPGQARAGYGPVRFLHALRAGGPIEIYGDGSELRDHVLAEDVAEAGVQLAERGEAGTFNLASGHSHSYAEILSHIAACVRSPFEVVHQPRSRTPIDQAFEIGALRRALPELTPTRVEAGIRQCAEDLGLVRRTARTHARRGAPTPTTPSPGRPA